MAETIHLKDLELGMEVKSKGIPCSKNIVLQPLRKLLQTSEILLERQFSRGDPVPSGGLGTLTDPKPVSFPLFPCALAGLSWLSSQYYQLSPPPRNSQ